MKKSTIYWIIGIALVIFLISKRKNNNSYRVIKEIQAGSGYIHDVNGNLIAIQSLVPKVGDIINGQIKESYIMNQKRIGIIYPIELGEGVDNRTKIFIPEDNLEKI